VETRKQGGNKGDGRIEMEEILDLIEIVGAKVGGLGIFYYQRFCFRCATLENKLLFNRLKHCLYFTD